MPPARRSGGSSGRSDERRPSRGSFPKPAADLFYRGMLISRVQKVRSALGAANISDRIPGLQAVPIPISNGLGLSPEFFEVIDQKGDG